MSFIDSKKLKYAGADLEAMASADNYYAWIIKCIKPYLGDKVVEVGAGSGSFSKQILKHAPKEAVFIEPTKNMYELLHKRVRANASKHTKITSHQAYMSGVVKKVGTPDSIVYINVFEHIEDDKKELKMLSKAIKRGGHIVIFVPALKPLLSEFDRSIGHFRRYNKMMLRELATSADLEIVKLKYFDMFGIIPWFVNFKFLGKKTMKPGAVSLYDKAMVPIIRVVESIFPVPIGKNLLLVVRKK